MNLFDRARLRAAGWVVAVGLAACHGDTKSSPLDGAVPSDGGRDAPLDASTSLDAVVPLDSSGLDPFAPELRGDGGLLDVCRASKTWRFESELLGGRAPWPYRRSDGFVLGKLPADESATYLFLGESEPRTAQVVLEPSSALLSLPIGKDRTHVGALLFKLGRDESGADTAEAQLYPAGAVSLGPIHTLGQIYRRGSMAVAAGSSFDGQRALFTTGHVATKPPVAFLVDGDGARVGDAFEFSVAPDQLRLPECLTVTPTAHAAAFSVLASDTQTWRFKEVAADGAVVQEVSFLFDVRLSASPCPTISPTPTGFIAAFDRGNQSIQLLKVAAGQVESRIVVATGHTLPQWLGETTTGRLLWLDKQMISPGEARYSLSLLFEDGAFRTIDEDLGSAQVVPSEVGHLYVLRSAMTSAPLVEEIRCRGVELAN